MASTDKKRVGVLLRVSTDMQVTQSNKQESDIPTQRTACNRFIQTRDDWELEKEYVEIGVSGFKNKMVDRDKVNEIIGDIQEKRIDVLLVYMFDRLARTEDEAPAVVKRLVMMGAEVWSCREGQMKFDNHIDSLMNFITFWQAAGESKKTSERVTTAMTQMAEQGQYTGGKPPYGYRTVDTGRLTKKKLPEKMLVIDECQARVVRMMYDLAGLHGYGSRRIARYLNENGYCTQNGKQWIGSTIATLLANPIYKGVKAYKRTTSKGEIGFQKGQRRIPEEEWILAPYTPQLAIVSQEQWDRAAKTRAKNWQGRSKETGGTNGGWTKLLLTGFIYCGCCGAALMQGYSSYSWITQDQKRHTKNFPNYKCSGKSSGAIGCTARTSYSQSTIEGVVLEEIGHYLNALSLIDLSGDIHKLFTTNLAYEQSVVKDLEKKVSLTEKRIAGLEQEILKIACGESALPREKLSEMFEKESQLHIQHKQNLSNAQRVYNEKMAASTGLQALQKAVPVWQDVFDRADLAAKKVMLAKMIQRVTVWPEKVEVNLHMEIEEFFRLGCYQQPQNCSDRRPY